MSNFINIEKKLILILAYTFAMSFALVGILLASVFNNLIFINLTFKFIMVSLLPIVVFYQIDTLYLKHAKGDLFIQSHLAWITHSYIIYSVAFYLQYRLINKLAAYLNLDLSLLVLVLFAWLSWRYIRGVNLALNQQPAPACCHYFPSFRRLLQQLRFK